MLIDDHRRSTTSDNSPFNLHSWVESNQSVNSCGLPTIIDKWIWNLNWTVIYSKEPNIFFGRGGDGRFWDFLFGHNFSFVSELTIHFFKEGISILSINMNFHLKILIQWFNKKKNWLISLIALDTNYFSFYNNTVLNNMLYWTRINNKEYIIW